MAPIAPRILSLGLARFRNHQETALETKGAPFVVLAGPNGAGKTAVLEALSLFSVGRGLRAARLSEMAMAGAGGFAVTARLALEPDLPPVALATGTAAAAPERREVRVNGAPATATGLSEWLAILWVTPAMDRLFQDSPGARRRFLDRLVLALEPAHAGHAARFEAAARERMRLLTGERRAEAAWLDALEEQAARHGAALAEARARTVEALAARIAAGADAAFPEAALALEGEDWSDPVRLRAALLGARARDAAAGRATAGPQRTDLVVRLAASGLAAAHASTGEQKALLAGLLLAHAGLVAEARGKAPLLLFDEVAAHLDPGRRAALFARLAALGGQCWLTGTEAGLFASVPRPRLDVRLEAGRVLEARVA